jgi:NADH dehydrogenase
MKVVIVGAGFAGLALARKLSNKKNIQVVLIDKNNYHQFQPLFYQVATAGLDASNISFPLRKIFHGSKNVKILVAEVSEIRPSEKMVITSVGQMNYDYLVLAQGATTHFFGNKAIEQYSFPMKSTVEALQLRHRLIELFEKASMTTSKEERSALLTVVVAGGGPTGVEVSGALAEMKKNMLPKDYPELSPDDMQIHLVEGSNNTLNAMSKKSSDQSRRYLETLGVSVWTGCLVNDFNDNNVYLSNGNVIQSHLLIWAAGIIGNHLNGLETLEKTRSGRFMVDQFNKTADSCVFAIGDVAYMEAKNYPKGHPQVANVAINQAKNLANNLLRLSRGSSDLLRFEYSDKGSMATVGRHLAVVDIPSLHMHFGGFIAWLIWMGLHLLLILGLKNRLQVFVNWIYKYITYDQSLRLLFINTYRPLHKSKTIVDKL